MNKRHVRFENIQDALLWLMTNRFNKEDDAKLFDQYGNYFIHSEYNNIIEHYWYYGDSEDEYGNLISGDWDFDRLSYEDFISQFEGTVLENNV